MRTKGKLPEMKHGNKNGFAYFRSRVSQASAGIYIPLKLALTDLID
jgi:hypothetical protein